MTEHGETYHSNGARVRQKETLVFACPDQRCCWEWPIIPGYSIGMITQRVREHLILDAIQPIDDPESQ